MLDPRAVRLVPDPAFLLDCETQRYYRDGVDLCFMPMVVDICLSKAIFRVSVCEPGVFGQLFSPDFATTSAVARAFLHPLTLYMKELGYIGPAWHVTSSASARYLSRRLILSHILFISIINPTAISPSLSILVP